MQRIAVVVGAAGGIGSALVDALVEMEGFDAVHGISRRPGTHQAGVHSHIADVTDEASIERVAGVIADMGSIELVLVATAFCMPTRSNLSVMRIEVSSDPSLDSVITFATEAKANIALRLPPTVIAELEALLARASQEQAKLLPKQ